MASPTLRPSDILALPGGVKAVIRSEPAKALMRLVERVASSPAAVLIQGETGTGKELIARAIHHLSARNQKPWVDINCAALPEHLVESELFGHEKGAFSGADSIKIGLFELANGGTLFLDEIGELDPKVQGKLLRVLDGAPYYRLGGTKKVPVDVRVIAATNRDLRAQSESGKFRSDLYFRLSQIQLFVPPLRERAEDLEEIAEQFLNQCRPGTKLSADALEFLKSYPWPGNIRELKNVMISTAAWLDSESKTIHTKDLPKEINSFAADVAIEEVPEGNLDSMERIMIERALKEHGGQQAEAAEALGISRRTLSRKIKAYELEGTPVRGNNCVGSLNVEQFRYFRAALDQPVILRSDAHGQTVVDSVNLSSSGIGVRHMADPHRFNGVVELEFTFPGSDRKISVKGKVTWADFQGNAGIRFVAVPRNTQQLIDEWMTKKRTEEGWAGVPAASAILDG